MDIDQLGNVTRFISIQVEEKNIYMAAFSFGFLSSSWR
jgi:hypothetical protein